MDGAQFDSIARSLVRSRSRRGALATLAAFGGFTALTVQDLQGKRKPKKNKNKKKKSNCRAVATCKPLDEICKTECDCCGKLGCTGGVCCVKSSGSCAFSADCCGTLTCQPIGGGGTCKPCVTANGACIDTSECCGTGPPFLTCQNNVCVS